MITQYIDQMRQLIGTSFGFDMTDMTDVMFINFLNMHSLILIAFDGLKIIGTLYVNGEQIVRPINQKDHPIIPYTLQRSFAGNRNYFETMTYYLFPMICNFCRIPDDRYKGVGQIMLQKIIDRFRKNGYKSIYCVPESIIGLVDSRENGMCGLNDYDNRDNLYYKENMKLIGYYRKLGFDIYDNHYVVDFCSDKLGDSDYISFPVMYMKL